MIFYSKNDIICEQHLIKPIFFEHGKFIEGNNKLAIKVYEVNFTFILDIAMDQ